MNNWISVKDKIKPPNDKSVLVYKNGICSVGKYCHLFEYSKDSFKDDNGNLFSGSHWMLLPEALK